MTVVLVGPTAVGKSALAVALAHRYRQAGRPAEVVSADSMLVYRGMDIGTAKPTVAEREGIPHHLLDVLDVSQTATVAEFQAMARSAIADCRARGVVPVVVGGSALYVRAVVDDFVFPGTDPELRRQLEAELERWGPERLHARLARQDPAAAAVIEPANGRRIVRALEVGELTGQPYAATLPEHHYLLPDVVQIGLAIERPVLDARIEARVAAMWRAGFVDEVRALAAGSPSLRDGLTASRALGYRQLLAHLDGELSEEQAREATVTATRKFARRQGGWFRRDSRIHWLAWDRADLVDAAHQLAGPRGDGRPAPVDRPGPLPGPGGRLGPMRQWSFSKGHGTGNDFVVLLDQESQLQVGPAEVRFLCDRHAGIGGDGLLRVVRARHVPEWRGDGELWFMDYRNADGSVAEMCGNGVRVFVRFLLDHGLATGPTVDVATRAGVKEATVLPDGRVRVAMGPVTVAPGWQVVDVQTADGSAFRALPADVGNPHAVGFTDHLARLALHTAPAFPAERFPDGVNLEFVHVLGPRHIAMRVHERGVGETQSCGTGTVAAAAATRVHTGDTAALPLTYRVDVPGGSVDVELTEDQAYLTGPAVLVAQGQVTMPEEG